MCIALGYAAYTASQRRAGRRAAAPVNMGLATFAPQIMQVGTPQALLWNLVKIRVPHAVTRFFFELGPRKIVTNMQKLKLAEFPRNRAF